MVVVPRLQVTERGRRRSPRQSANCASSRMIASERRAVDFDGWLAGRAEAAAALIPSEGLVFRPRLMFGPARRSMCWLMVDPHQLLVAAGEWSEGHVSERAIKVQPGAIVEVAEAGDLDRDRPFTFAAWVRLKKQGQSGSVVARMDDRHEHRGWDMWIGNGRLGAHLIHQWDQDAIKVVTETELKVGNWNHLLVSYDGSGQAAGLKFYVNGGRLKSKVQVDRLTNSIRTEVPLKIGQRDSARCSKEHD